jgi:hypothetical protein
VEEDLGVATVEVTAGVETAEEEDSEVVKDSVVVDWGAVMAAEDSGAVVTLRWSPPSSSTARSLTSATS